MAKDATWIDDQPYYEDDLELYNAINNTVDLKWIEEEEQPSNKKRVQAYEQDDTSMTSFKTSDYVPGSAESVDSIEIDNPSDNSAQGSERPSAPA